VPAYIIFLSYTSNDAGWAEQLKADVHQYSDWQLVDLPTDLAAGDDWKDAGTDMLRRSDGVLCLIGPRTANSSPVDWELRTAKAFGKPVVAVRLDESSGLPSALEELGIRTTRWERRVDALKALVPKR
jgi:hypothetical protein